MQILEHISGPQKIVFGDTENVCFLRFQSTDNQYRYSHKITPNSTGKELDSETGYSYFGARYLDHELTTSWLSVDPMSDKYPNISPYNYCNWNPVKLVDPDGKWAWSRSGDLVAQIGDDVFTMAEFLGTSVNNCIIILNRCGLITTSGINITEGCHLPQKHLWIDSPVSQNNKTVDNSIKASFHYYFGNGEPVNIGDVTTSGLFNSSEFADEHRKVTKSKDSFGSFNIDLTKKIFHIGRTKVKWEKERGLHASTITYTAFYQDGFWDPAFWSEKTLGNWSFLKKIPLLGDLYQPDGKGPNLETGGIPYDYIPRKRTFFYNPEDI